HYLCRHTWNLQPAGGRKSQRSIDLGARSGPAGRSRDVGFVHPRAQSDARGAIEGAEVRIVFTSRSEAREPCGKNISPGIASPKRLGETRESHGQPPQKCKKVGLPSLHLRS